MACRDVRQQVRSVWGQAGVFCELPGVADRAGHFNWLADVASQRPIARGSSGSGGWHRRLLLRWLLLLGRSLRLWLYRRLCSTRGS